jgi:hypothetical protein
VDMDFEKAGLDSRHSVNSQMNGWVP